MFAGHSGTWVIGWESIWIAKVKLNYDMEDGSVVQGSSPAVPISVFVVSSEGMSPNSLSSRHSFESRWLKFGLKIS